MISIAKGQVIWGVVAWDWKHVSHIWICLQWQGGCLRDSQARGNKVKPLQRKCPSNSLVKEMLVWQALLTSLALYL